ncbi:glycosyltransferase family 2 protein [Pararhodobacter zhoushanensis]|uniref:glycosyltransferase family 2 protein n=1 Tax=Pararhodobacter zhoushanensis TaxID=2479545 RepID=UPI000F8C8473|nr:glycosyltransferase family 2 protein [Pararhodobacter zhoushanensis]
MADSPEISVVVVCWNMARELPRTLWSLSRTFQQGIDDLHYEIIVVDNGSDSLPVAPAMEPAPQIRRVSRPSASPVGAMNEALALAKAPLIGAWIDGARLASANLLDCVRAAAAHHPAPVIATMNRQFGPAHQSVSARDGYNQTVEDALLETAGWPNPEADLVAVSCPEMSSTSGAILESNALFMARHTWDALGGYDPAFTDAGGGMCNPDMLTRAVAHPGTQLIYMKGVSTFHQIHGGTSTSDADKTVAMVKQASRAYNALRGHPPRMVREKGWVFDAANGTLAKG